MSIHDRRKIRSALKTKGFTEKAKSDHDRFEYGQEPPKGSLYTELPRGSKYRELPKWLVGTIKRQLKLDSEQFEGLVRCPIGQEEYEAILIEKGILPDPRATLPPSEKDLPKERYDEVYSRVYALVEEEFDHQKLYPLVGKIESETFTMADLQTLERLEILADQKD